MRAPARAREQTGNPVLGRIQQKIDECVTRVKYILATLQVVGVGSVDIEIPDKDYFVVTLEQAACVHWSFRGTLTQDRTVIVPAAVARNRSFVRWAENLTDGGFDISLVSSSGGATALIPSTDTVPVLVQENNINALL
jgi:hypothetical protein